MIVRSFLLIFVTNIIYKTVLNSFFLKPVTEKEVLSAFNEMKTNKSIGPNTIPTQILKISNQIVCKPLPTKSFFLNGVFSELLKT